MKPRLALSVILVLAGCNTAPAAPDCATAFDRAVQCFDEHDWRFSNRMLVTCVPYSEPERMAGTWARDFEFDQFYEGRELSPDAAWQFPDESIKLSIDGGGELPKDAEGIPQAVVSWVELEGRRPLCDLTPGERILVVDRIVSERIIESRPSEW